MNNMKRLMNLIASLSLTSIAGTSVTACNNSSSPQTSTFTNQVQQDLGLIDTSNLGLILPTINFDSSNNASWKLDISKITFANLVNSSSKAKNQDDYNFLKNTLKIKVDSGTNLNDTIFNASEIGSCTITSSDLSVTLSPMQNNFDYYISESHFNIQFTNGSTQTEKYKIEGAIESYSGTPGIFFNLIPTLTSSDFNSDFQDKFKAGQPVAPFATGTDVTSMILTTTDNTKRLWSLQNLINMKLVIVTNITDQVGQNFVAGNKVNFLMGFGTIKNIKSTILTIS